MFDIISRRRWFYLFSLIVTIPGLFFILLTPTGNGGLQFTIDYTGGTRWEVRFEDPAVTPDQVKYRLMYTANKAWPGYSSAKAGAGPSTSPEALCCAPRCCVIVRLVYALYTRSACGYCICWLRLQPWSPSPPPRPPA